MQVSDIEEESEVIRLVNLLRIAMYFLAAWIQFPLYLDCVSSSGASFCDQGAVLVPVILGILDGFLVLWSTRPSYGLRAISAMLSITAIAIAVTTVVPFFLNIDYIIPMIILGFVVIGISLVELAKLIGSFQNQSSMQSFETSERAR